MSDYSHQFLVSMPLLDGDYFSQSVIYICTHDERGTLGLVINKPVDYTITEIFEQLELDMPKSIKGIRLIEGGPVASDVPLILHTDDWQSENTWLLPDGLALTFPSDEGRDFFDLFKAIVVGEGPKQFLLALGHSGWGGGQLDAEIEENTWLTCSYDPKVLFDIPFEKRYQRICDNLGFDINLISRHGGDA